MHGTVSIFRILSTFCSGAGLRTGRLLCLTVVLALTAGTLSAQSVKPRIASEIGSGEGVALKNSLHPLAQAQYATGRLDGATRMQGMTLVFNRSAAQKADLEALLVAQQNPHSPLYHQWLTPEKFAARFGMAQADIDKTKIWLEQQGFQVNSVSRSRTFVRFSGTARQVEQAFSTQMHTYSVGGERHIAPGTELHLPSALAAVIESVQNLNDFRPHPSLVKRRTNIAQPGFTSNDNGWVYFAPGDIATIYNVKALTNAGYTGAGQTITIVGQSAVEVADMEAFQKAAGLPVKDPTMVLVPNTGTATLYAGDENESDLDLEWSSAMAPGANITFVYTGDSQNSSGIFDSIQYAVDNQIGNILSVSYGACEQDLGNYTIEGTLAQAAAQGQTVLVSSGDDGATACYRSSNSSTPKALAVSYPASSPYVTAVGGTEISKDNAAYMTAGDGYWTARSSSDVISSALKYIPEVTWNDDSTSGLSAAGGGKSINFSKPWWQTGVAGIPSDGARDLPDISLQSSPNYPGFLFCSSDTSFWRTDKGQKASCNSGFRDSSSGLLTVAGGTSFATPIFAGMVAILNQKNGDTNGSGLINVKLYELASNATSYATAFHDITEGTIDCTAAGATYCSNIGNFDAGAGYDLATGLGSIDLANLAGVWQNLIATTTTISSTPASPTVGQSTTFTITVAAASGTNIPSGTVGFSAAGGTVDYLTLTSNGTATYTGTFTAAGTYQLVAEYEGDSTHNASTGTLQVTVSGTSTSTGTFTLTSSPSTLTVSRGSSGTETLTVTPANNYTGTVLLTFKTSDDNALANLCYAFTNTLSDGRGSLTVSGANAVTTQLLLDARASDCVSSSAAGRTMSGKPMYKLGNALHAQNNAPTPTHNPQPLPLAAGLGGLALAGIVGRRSRRLRGLAVVAALAALSLTFSACGGGGGGSNSGGASNPPKGNYTITVTGRDSATSTITSTSSFTFTIQ